MTITMGRCWPKYLLIKNCTTDGMEATPFMDGNNSSIIYSEFDEMGFGGQICIVRISYEFNYTFMPAHFE